MPTWCAGRLATLLPLFAGCPRGVPAGWLPYCHYLQDAHVVCRQAGYPLGALEAVLHSKYGAAKDINLDEVDCTGKVDFLKGSCCHIYRQLFPEM
jgi:hypothetical protein